VLHVDDRVTEHRGDLDGARATDLVGVAVRERRRGERHGCSDRRGAAAGAT